MDPPSAPVCIVDDDASVRESLEGLLRSSGLRTATFASAQQFLERPSREIPACLILDVNLPGLSGFDLQDRLLHSQVDVPTIFLTGHGTIPSSVRAMKSGAVDYFTKPFDAEQLLDAVRAGIARTRLAYDSVATADFHDFVGESPTLRHVLGQINLVAKTDATVFITGESGTGKELVARAIHERSRRHERPLIKVNCGAIPENLFESEFFGHVRGAFTGAMRDKPGRFELAQGGTLFLDEVGEIPLGMQVKLLRALQEHEIERVGDTRSRRVDVRIIAATNRDPWADIEAGRFRSDLFYRLSVFPIRNPPLRERQDDVRRLVRHFTDKFARQMSKRIRTIPVHAMEAMSAYSWPGNVRELQNFIERAVIVSTGSVLCAPLEELDRNRDKAAEAARSLESVERDCILQALTETRWRVGGPHGAAQKLGLKRTTLLSRMVKLGIGRHEASMPIG